MRRRGFFNEAPAGTGYRGRLALGAGPGLGGAGSGGAPAEPPLGTVDPATAALGLYRNGSAFQEIAPTASFTPPSAPAGSLLVAHCYAEDYVQMGADFIPPEGWAEVDGGFHRWQGAQYQYGSARFVTRTYFAYADGAGGPVLDLELENYNAGGYYVHIGATIGAFPVTNDGTLGVRFVGFTVGANGDPDVDPPAPGVVRPGGAVLVVVSTQEDAETYTRSGELATYPLAGVTRTHILEWYGFAKVYPDGIDLSAAGSLDGVWTPNSGQRAAAATLVIE